MYLELSLERRAARQSLNALHGPLKGDPKQSIERTVTVLGRKIQTQTLILSGTSLAVAIALLFSKEEKDINHEVARTD